MVNHLQKQSSQFIKQSILTLLHYLRKNNPKAESIRMLNRLQNISRQTTTFHISIPTSNFMMSAKILVRFPIKELVFLKAKQKIVLF